VSNYYDQYMMPLVKEMIDRFDPDGLWMDGAWMTPTENAPQPGTGGVLL